MAADCMFVTCAEVPELDPDDRFLVAELQHRGISSVVGVWDDPSVDWASGSLCILRSTWDYHRRYAAFMQWIDRAATVTTVYNPPELLRWNTDKSYLSELGSLGVPVLPTVRVGTGCRENLRRLAAAQGWSDVVVKPAQGAAAHGVLRVPLGDEFVKHGQAHLDRLTATGDALVQPYFSSVTTYGERSLIFFDGFYSHAVVKKPFDTVLVVGTTAAVRPSTQEIAVANAAVRRLPQTPLYARVDLMLGDDGNAYVNELELIEPGLYIGAHQPACAAFASAIERRLSSSYRVAQYRCQ